MDKGAGVDLYKKLGDTVKKGEALYCVHAEFPSDFNFARALCKQSTGYRIGTEEQIPRPYVEF
jgi:thymidine phosphorylase